MKFAESSKTKRKSTTPKPSKAPKKREEVLKCLKNEGFIFKQIQQKYTLAKLAGGDIIFLRIYNTNVKVYPVGNYDAWKSNTVLLTDLDTSKSLLHQLLINNKK